MRSIVLAIALFAICVNGDYQPTPYAVLQVNYTIDELKVPQLVAHLIDTEYYMSFDPNAKADQILVSTNINELSYETWQRVMNESRLNFTRFDVEKLAEIAKAMHIPTTKEFNKLTMTFENRRDQMNSGLSAINVDGMRLLVYMFDNPIGDEKFFNHFAKANITQKNWNKMLKIFKMTNKDVFQFAKDLSLDYLQNITLREFNRLLKNITGEVKSFNQGYEQEQVGLLPSLFKHLEFYLDGSFLNMVETYNKSLNQNETLQVASRIARGQYITAKEVGDQIEALGEYTSAFLVDFMHRHLPIVNVTFNKSLATLTTNDRHPVVYKFNKNLTANCFYYNPNGDLIKVIALEKNGIILLDKTPKLRFIMGAPLFCDSNLFGVASREDAKQITFAKTNLAMPNATIEGGNLMVHVDFHVRLDKAPTLIAYLMLNTTDFKQVQFLAGSDFIDPYKLRNLTFAQFEQGLKQVGRTALPFRVVDTLTSMNISIIDLYSTFYKYLTNVQEENMLKALNISQMTLHRTLLFNPTDEAKFLAVINTGIFNKTTIEKAINATGMNVSQIFDLLKNTYLERAAKQPLVRILEFFKQNGGYKLIEEFVKLLNVSAHHFQDSGLAKLVLNFEEKLLDSTALAVPISRRHILSTNAVFDMWSDNVTQEFVSLKARTAFGEFVNVSQVTPYDAGYSNITLAVPLSNNQMTIEFSQGALPLYCYMLTDENAYAIRDFQSVTKGYLGGLLPRDAEKFQLGSGLVCDKLLYGIGLSKTPNYKVHFAHFRNPKVMEISTAKPASKGNTLSISFSLVICIISIIFINI